MNKTRIVANGYGFEAAESYMRYVPQSSSIQEDINEIVLQLLMEGYEIDRTHAYWAWLNYSSKSNGSWLPVSALHDIPVLLNGYISKEIKQ